MKSYANLMRVEIQLHQMIEIKKTFVMLGNEKLPDQKDLVQEINPEIRVDSITKAF